MSEPRQVLLILALLTIMGISIGLGTRRRSGAVMVALASLVWLLVDTSFEGATLIVVTSRNGLTSSDLVAVFGLIVAAVQLYRLRRPRR